MRSCHRNAHTKCLSNRARSLKCRLNFSRHVRLTRSWSLLHADAVMAGAGAVLTQVIEHKEFMPFASDRSSNTNANRGPTEREFIAVFYAVPYFCQYLAGQRFSVVIKCSVLTWISQRRDFRPKLHPWVLKVIDS